MGKIIRVNPSKTVRSVHFHSHIMEKSIMNVLGIKQLLEVPGAQQGLIIKEYTLKTLMNGEFVEKDAQLHVS